MSEAPDLTEAEALAAEHALGVLDARERAEAETRMARDPAFAADVEAWRHRLAPMLDSVAAVPAPPGTWLSATVCSMPPIKAFITVERSPKYWKAATSGATVASVRPV